MENIIQRYNEKIQNNPKHAHYYHERGLMYQQLGKLNKACDDLKMAAKLGQNNPFHLRDYINIRREIIEKEGQNPLFQKLHQHVPSKQHKSKWKQFVMKLFKKQ